MCEDLRCTVQNHSQLVSTLKSQSVGQCDVKSADRNMNLRCHQYLVGLRLNTASLSLGLGSLCKMLGRVLRCSSHTNLGKMATQL